MVSCQYLQSFLKYRENKRKGVRLLPPPQRFTGLINTPLAYGVMGQTYLRTVRVLANVPTSKASQSYVKQRGCQAIPSPRIRQCPAGDYCAGHTNSSTICRRRQPILLSNGHPCDPLQEMILLKGVMGTSPLSFPSNISAANAAQGFPELA